MVAAAPGDTRGEYDGVASLYLPIAIAVFAFVVGAIAIALVRYRARPGRAARPTRERLGVELGIAALIAAIVAVLVSTTFASERRIDRVTKRAQLRVQVTAFRWGWRFSYPGLGGIATVSGVRRPPILRVPTGAHVSFDVISRDVIHAFWIPELRFKRDVFPDRHELFDLTFPREVSFLGGECAVFCGLLHPDMRFSVMVMAPGDFRAWADAQRRRSG